MSYDGLRQAALEWDAIQQTRLKINNMLKAFDRLKRPYPDLIAPWLEQLASLETQRLKFVRAQAEDGEPWLHEVVAYIDATRGLGPAVLCVLGLIPPLPQFPNPAKLWAYLGLAVSDGAAVRVPLPPPPNNPRGPKGHHFSRRIRAYATVRIVEPIIRDMQSPLRAVYDGRRLHTASTHPEWGEERNKAGELVPNMHYHRDAIRYTAKRIWRDVWRVAVGDQLGRGTHTPIVAEVLPL